MVTSVRMSPPWSLPAPPRWRRIDLCLSLVSLSFFFFPLLQGRQCLFEVRSVLDGVKWWWVWSLSARSSIWRERSSSRSFSIIRVWIFHLVWIYHGYPGSISSFAFLLELMGDALLFVSCFFPLRCPWGRPLSSSQEQKGGPLVLDVFLFLLCSFSQEVHCMCSRRHQCPFMINILHCVLGSVSSESHSSMFPTSWIIFLILDWRD